MKIDYRKISMFSPTELMELSDDSCHVTGRIKEARAEESKEPQSVKLYRRLLRIQSRINEMIFDQCDAVPENVEWNLAEYSQALREFLHVRQQEEANDLHPSKS